MITDKRDLHNTSIINRRLEGGCINRFDPRPSFNKCGYPIESPNIKSMTFKNNVTTRAIPSHTIRLPIKTCQNKELFEYPKLHLENTPLYWNNNSRAKLC